VATKEEDRPFDHSDFVVFQSIAEQASFALYAAVMFGEAHEKRRMQNDLDVARDIQRILLPEAAPEVPGFGISGTNVPARQVSGDYFDYIQVGEHLTGIAIADVSGKGVPAALIMAMCRSVLRGNAQGNPSAADVLHKVNRQLYPDIQEDMFISMAYMIVDDRTKEVTLARAGHDAPLLCTSTGVISKLNPAGMALGIDSGNVFDRITVNHQFILAPGDTLLLYTDGITEALDADGEEFGLDRLSQILRVAVGENPQELVQRISDEVTGFSGAGPQHDDITMVAIRRTRSGD
jgi:sigma-B regulation protein RsbU (phosphoserine phosphatase)